MAPSGDRPEISDLIVAFDPETLARLPVQREDVCSALAVYVLTRHEVRTLATVAILGPLTLARPAVIAGAALIGLGRGASWPAVALTLAACGAVVGGGAWLERRYRGRTLDEA